MGNVLSLKMSATSAVLHPGLGGLVQPDSLRTGWGQSQSRAPPVPTGKQRPAGVEQGQQRRTNPHLARGYYATIYSQPSEPPAHCAFTGHQQLYDPQKHTCQGPALLTLSGRLCCEDVVGVGGFKKINSIHIEISFFFSFHDFMMFPFI